MTTQSPLPLTDDALFSLSTQIAEPRYFDIDSTRYVMKDIRHIDDSDEARFRVLLKTDEYNNRRLDDAIAKGHQLEARKWAMATRKSRIDMILIMTDVPREIVERLGLTGQTTIINHILAGPGVQKEEEEDGEEEGLEQEADGTGKAVDGEQGAED